MGKGSKPPKPADPVKTAAAQTGQNIGTATANAWMNNVNQVTPDGSLTYDQTGSYQWEDPNSPGKFYDIPTFTATQTLSPEQQAINSQNNQASLNLATLAADQSGRMGDLLSNDIDISNLPKLGNVNDIRRFNAQKMGNGPNLQTELGNAGSLQRQIANSGSIQRNLGDAGSITRSYGTDFSKDRQRVEDALMERMNPNLDRDRDRLENRLASQGIRMGSEAYQSAMGDFGRQSNDARLGAILNAGQEQSRLAGLEAQRAGFENSAQSQAFGQLAQRGNFTNQAQQQRFGQNAANAQFANNAQGQAFQEKSARAGFHNDALQQGYQNQANAIAANNRAGQAEVNADMSRFDAQNNLRNQALQEAFARRNQPINEVTSLMSGSQVNQPNFVNANTSKIPTTDFAGIQANYDKSMLDRWQAKQAQSNSLFGNLLGFGASIFNSYKTSDRR